MILGRRRSSLPPDFLSPKAIISLNVIGDMVIWSWTLYVLTGKKRSERLESYKNIPLDDEDLDEEHRKD